MSLNEDLKNCKIIIRDAKTGKTIADTVILTYDAGTGQIEVGTNRIVIPMGLTVSALIFSASGIFESHGTVGAKEGKKTRITLCEGSGQNDRQALRYQVNIRGEAEYVVRPEKGKLPGGFGITLLNMSSIGILIQVPEGKVQVGDTIRFAATGKGRRLTITALALRVEHAGAGKEKIGCSIQLVNLG